MFANDEYGHKATYVHWTNVMTTRYADRRKVVIMVLNTRHRNSVASPSLESLYPRDSFITLEDGSIVPVFLGHPDAMCDECEMPFGNTRVHPNDPERPHLIRICGGHLMKLTRGRA